MANFVYNTGKGRFAAFYERVDTNDPAASTIGMLILDASGIETDAALIDSATVTQVLDGTTNEVGNTGYARKNLSDTDLAAYAPDNTNDRADVTFPDQVFSTILAGAVWSDLVICYDSLGTQADATMIPLSQHDFSVTPNGGDITADFDATAAIRAT